MNNFTKCVITAGVAGVISSCGTSNSIDNCADIDTQVNALYEKLTPGERLAQIQGIYINELVDDNNKIIDAKCKELIPNGVGHFSQFALNSGKSADVLRDIVAQLQEWIAKNTPNGVPALFHEEVLSGINALDATVYPQQIGLACSFNTELAEKKTYQTATGLRKTGGFMALSPMVDVCRNPSFNRLEESYGEDSYLSAAMGVAFVKGLQHGDLKQGVAACTKHFLGYGGGGDCKPKELMEEILLPHEAIIREAGSHVLMPGYHAINGIKCVANKDILQGILRDYLKFDGIVVSDYGAIEQVDDNLTSLERAAAAINAGNDVDFPGGDSYKLIPEAIKQGLVTEETFETSVKRVLKLKFMVGLLGNNVKLYDEGPIKFDSNDERETAYQLATQSVVMLKNNGILPLKTPKKIALVGPNANQMWAMLGDYTFQSMRYFWKSSTETDVNPRIVKLKDGMTERMPEGFSLEYSRGCEWSEVVETLVEKSGDPRVAYLKDIQNRMVPSNETADWDDAIVKAKNSDVIVAAVGENVMLCGENRDRQHLRLPGRQEEFVNALVATGKPVVLVIFGGRAQIISGLAEKCAAIIQAWYPGEEGGNAIADIIYGKVNPSGKLSVSYPAEEIREDVCYNYGLLNDSRIAYPFGYGLSYTTFSYSNIRGDSSVDVNAENLKISLDVKNTGNMAGDEIVQLYISPLDRSMNHKPIQLQGFKRISLKEGETATVTFAISPQQFGYWCGNEWCVDPGRFIIKIGASSADIRQEMEVKITGNQLIMPLRTRYFSK